MYAPSLRAVRLPLPPAPQEEGARRNTRRKGGERSSAGGKAHWRAASRVLSLSIKDHPCVSCSIHQPPTVVRVGCVSEQVYAQRFDRLFHQCGEKRDRAKGWSRSSNSSRVRSSLLAHRSRRSGHNARVRCFRSARCACDDAPSAAPRRRCEKQMWKRRGESRFLSEICHVCFLEKRRVIRLLQDRHRFLLACSRVTRGPFIAHPTGASSTSQAFPIDVAERGCTSEPLQLHWLHGSYAAMLTQPHNRKPVTDPSPRWRHWMPSIRQVIESVAGTLHATNRLPRLAGFCASWLLQSPSICCWFNLQTGRPSSLALMCWRSHSHQAYQCIQSMLRAAITGNPRPAGARRRPGARPDPPKPAERSRQRSGRLSSNMFPPTTEERADREHMLQCPGILTRDACAGAHEHMPAGGSCTWRFPQRALILCVIARWRTATSAACTRSLRQPLQRRRQMADRASRRSLRARTCHSLRAAWTCFLGPTCVPSTGVSMCPSRADSSPLSARCARLAGKSMQAERGAAPEGPRPGADHAYHPAGDLLSRLCARSGPPVPGSVASPAPRSVDRPCRSRYIAGPYRKHSGRVRTHTRGVTPTDYAPASQSTLIV